MKNSQFQILQSILFLNLCIRRYSRVNKSTSVGLLVDICLISNLTRSIYFSINIAVLLIIATWTSNTIYSLFCQFMRVVSLAFLPHLLNFTRYMYFWLRLLNITAVFIYQGLDDTLFCHLSAISAHHKIPLNYTS